jgi:phage protein D
MPLDSTPVNEAPVSARAAYSARPTVRIDGQSLAIVDTNLATCVMQESEGGMSTLTLGLDNWGTVAGAPGFLFDAGAQLALGKRIELYGGETSAPVALFDGVVMAMELKGRSDSSPTLTVLAEDKLQNLRMTRRTKFYESMSVSDVVQQIASAHAVTPDIADLGGVTGNWAQFNESDLAFLRRLLARHDGDVQLVDSTLQVRRMADMDRGTIELSLYGQLREVRVIADLADQVTKVTASGFDVSGSGAFTADSTGVHFGCGTGRKGSEILASLHDRSEHLTAQVCVTESEARALCDAAFDQRARRFVRVHGSCEGNARLRVGSRVKLAGLGQRFDNTYAVVEARHVYDTTNGYATEFVAQSAFLAQA